VRSRQVLQPLQVRKSAVSSPLSLSSDQVEFDQDMVIGSDAIERMSSMGACGLCALLLWLHCCWYERDFFAYLTLAREHMSYRCDVICRCTPGSAAAAGAGSMFQRAALTYAMQVSQIEEKNKSFFVKIYEWVFDICFKCLGPRAPYIFCSTSMIFCQALPSGAATAAAASHAMSRKYYRMLPAEVRRVVLEQVTKRDLVPVLRATGLKTLL
jgi:hypothetical protein